MNEHPPKCSQKFCSWTGVSRKTDGKRANPGECGKEGH